MVIILSLLLWGCNSDGEYNLSTSVLVNDHMVLQQQQENKIWGWGPPNIVVRASINDDVYDGITNAYGKWSITLPMMDAGGPYELMIWNATDTINVNDVMIGEVWVCSGQSNMEWILANTDSASLDIAQANDSLIRHIKIPRQGSATPADTLPGGQWELTTPETAPNFTAVGYHFAKHLRAELDVPVGLINSSWGGSAVEAWTSNEAPMSEEVSQIFAEMKAKQEKRHAEIIEKLGAFVDGATEEDRGMSADSAIYATTAFIDETWDKTALPGLWEESKLPGLDGIVWFRKTISLKKKDLEGPIELALAKIDDSDQVWVNGHLVGGMTGAHNVDRRYEIDPAILVAGKNTITVRVEDTGGGGGIYGSPSELFLRTNTVSIPLDGEWKFRVGAYRMTPQQINQTPEMLYNSMIHPMLGYGIKGVIWYQGESNAGGRRAFTYREQFPAMIKDWREKWGVGDFPFLFVQLANFKPALANPAPSDWAMLRESQSKTLETLENTGQAVIIDLGEADDIHPRNKRDVGYRLSLAARKIAYEEDIVFSGPVFKALEINENQALISFDHIGNGLEVQGKYGYLQGFAVAGEDQVFHWAKAKIQGDQVIVYSDQVTKPVAVRYAWADNPDDANLYNQEGLPATPFRTDDWAE